MTETNQVEKTLGEQMTDLLLRNPKNFDVVFSVGPEKVKVEAVKFILKAASPVFEREFDQNWEKREVKDENGIPLPTEDPSALQLFFNLLILDTWSVDSIKSLKLSPNDLLNLLRLCRRYEITKAIQNLEEAAEAFILSFHKYKDTEEFLEISRENLETIFSYENIPLEEIKIYECAMRWAYNQCIMKELELTGDNYRTVLGGCLFKVRFPTMSNEDFTKACTYKKDVLQAGEQLAIYLFIGLDIDGKKKRGKSELPFITARRKGSKLSSTSTAQPPITSNPGEVNTSSFSGCSVLSLPPQYKLTTNRHFRCNGSSCSKHFQVNQKISLYGIGFLGPIEDDTHFDVTVQIRKRNDDSWQFSETFAKNIFAQKGKVFHFLLDEPIQLESSNIDGNWNNYYVIYFKLKGTKHISQYKVKYPKDEWFESSGVHFFLNSSWNNGSPLAELLFKKI